MTPKEQALAAVRECANRFPTDFADLIAAEFGFPVEQPRQKTLRDEFAMACLAGAQEVDNSAEYIAERAYEVADAMMRARK